MKKITFRKAKDKVIKYCQRDFPKFAVDPEFNAIITHWLLEPTIKPPLMPEDIFTEIKQLFTSKNTKGKSFSHAVHEEQVSYQTKFSFCYDDIPFPPPENPAFSFIDLFAGIGGFRLAMQSLNGKCVFSSEWDKYAQKTYEANFGEVPYGDINQFANPNMSDEEISAIIPDHNILCGGFPCQPFSLAGVSKKNSMGRKHGFEDETQGTLFFNIARIIAAKKPQAFFLENVKNLLTHDGGKTFAVIERTLNELGYVFAWKVVDGVKWVPQHRERVFIVGFNQEYIRIQKHDIKIPTGPDNDYQYKRLNQIIQTDVNGYTLGVGTWNTLIRHKTYHSEIGNGFGYGIHTLPIPDDAVTRTISARYHKDGAEILIEQAGNRPRRLTVEEAKQLQGYPLNYKFPVSAMQSYKQIGNSVVVPAVSKCCKMLIDILMRR